MKPYPIQLEISGPTALWARPDTLPDPVSYVAPTFSAAKGVAPASWPGTVRMNTTTAVSRTGWAGRT